MAHIDQRLSSIALPEHLRPSDGRFGSGPSKVRQEAVAALAEAAPTYLGTSHRQPGVRAMVGRVRSGLRDLFALPDGYEVALGNGGSSVFWDVATFSLIERRSQHLVFGEFSSKFAAAAAAPHLDRPEVISSPYGTHPEPRANPQVDLYALTHNETSTGVSMPVRRPAGADGLVAVDGTSGAGGLPLDPAEFDVYYFAPQKCFASDAGLWIALLSPRAVERSAAVASSGRWMPASLSLQVALTSARADQTYNTPALATLFLLVHQLEWMSSQGGLDWACKRCDESAAVVYGWAEASDHATPFVADPGQRSHTVATIDLDPAIDAGQVAKVLRTNGIVDTESYRKLGRNQLRIALFPAIEPADLEVLTRAIDWIVARLEPVAFGGEPEAAPPRTPPSGTAPGSPG